MAVVTAVIALPPLGRVDAVAADRLLAALRPPPPQLATVQVGRSLAQGELVAIHGDLATVRIGTSKVTGMLVRSVPSRPSPA